MKERAAKISGSAKVAAEARAEKAKSNGEEMKERAANISAAEKLAAEARAENVKSNSQEMRKKAKKIKVAASSETTIKSSSNISATKH